MALVKIESGVKLLGNAVVKNKTSTYSLIELENGQILKNVEVDSDIDNFFQRTIKTNEPITLWFQKGFSSYTLIGLKIGDKTYVEKTGYGSAVFLAIFGVLTIPFFGVGFLVLIFVLPKTLGSISIINTIISEYPDAQKL